MNWGVQGPPSKSCFSPDVLVWSKIAESAWYSAIFKSYTKTSGHQIDTEDIVIQDQEERWFARGV